MSMLLDLDKDYLKDMDITLMGDIINILKHARVVANKNTSEMVLSDKVIKIFLNEGGWGRGATHLYCISRKKRIN